MNDDQKSELEALESIFDGDERFIKVTDNKFQYKFGDDGDAKSFLLGIEWPSDYPAISPIINLELFYNKHLSAETKSMVSCFLMDEAKNFLGMAVTYTLIEYARENYQEWIRAEQVHRKPVEADAGSSANADGESEASDSDDESRTDAKKSSQMTKAQKRRMWDRTEAGKFGERAGKTFQLMQTIIRVVTLNIWALPQPWPIGSRDRKYRIEQLIKTLLIERYDVLSLQELWSESDFETIANAVEPVMPYSHYFHSGFTGSGVCVFSAFPIVSTLMHRYSLNGFAHHVHRGDWFGGKVVGMVELQVARHRLNFYTTHLHAEYNRANDLYLPHRLAQAFELTLINPLAQAFELSQFIKHTSRGADYVIMTGDFNIEPEDLGYRLIVSNARLVDAWATKPNPCEDNSGMTCDRPDNMYTLPAILRLEDNVGKRLDYVLFKSGRANIDLLECFNCLNRIPDTEKNYSDHVGVYAKFALQESDHRNESEDWSVNDPLIEETVKILNQGELRAIWDRRLFMGIVFVLIAILLATLNVDAYLPGLSLPASIFRFILTLLIGFSMWYGFLGITMELKALKAAKMSMKTLLCEQLEVQIR